MLTFVSVCAAVYALVCIAAYLGQAKLVFFPGPPPSATPASMGLAFENVRLETRDGEHVRAWFVMPASTPGAAVLVCHGNAGSIENRLHLADAFVRMGLAVLMFDYRGYGGSSGAPTEAGLYADADAAYAHLRDARGFAPERIVLYGESMGGAVAIELATRERAAALVVEDTFTSLADVGAMHYRWLPVRWITRYRFDSLAKIARVEAPKLFIHACDDEIVPFGHGRALYDAAREPKEFVETSGGHNCGGFAVSEDKLSVVRSFLDAALAASFAATGAASGVTQPR